MAGILKVSCILWAIWGVFHVFIGVALVVLFTQEHPAGDFASIPTVLDSTMFGMTSPFAPIATLKQHAYNLAWIGLVVTVGSVYLWRKSVTALFVCALAGGLADLGYFVFIDLGGYATTPGPEMTYICAAAIVSSFYVYFRTDGLKNL